MNVAKPTPAQAEAGNYKMGHVRMHGLDITIETPRGRSRKPGVWPKMAAHYGYLKRTTGSDGDHVDVFIGPHRESQLVVVVDQVNKDGGFDEHKALIGWTSKEAAIAAYRKCFTPDWKVGPVTVMTIDQFKAWLADGSQKKPIGDQVSKYQSTADWLEQYSAKWVTIGADKSQPDGKQGGTPVMIGDGGKIEKGPDNLEGKPISKVDGDHDRTKSDHDRTKSDQPSGRSRVSAGGATKQWEQAGQKIRDDAEKQKAEREAHPHHMSKLAEQVRKALLDWHYDAHAATRGMEQRAHGANVAGADPAAAKRQQWKGGEIRSKNDPSIDEARSHLKLGPSSQRIEGVKDQVTDLASRLQAMIKEHATQGIDVKPFIRHNNLIPRPMAAKLKPNDSLFRPVTDDERFQVAFDQAMIERYAAKRPKNSPGQLGLFGDG